VGKVKLAATKSVKRLSFVDRRRRAKQQGVCVGDETSHDAGSGEAERHGVHETDCSGRTVCQGTESTL